MRVGIDIREFRKSKITGISRYLQNLIDIAMQQKSDYELYLYGNQFTNIDKIPENCSVKIIHENLTFWWDQITLPRQLKKDAIDIFLSPYYKAPIVSKRPIIITIHDVMFLYISSRKVPWKWIYNMLFKILARIIASKAKSVITDSHNSKAEIIQYLKIPEEKIKVVYLGISPHFKPIVDKNHIAQCKKKYGIKGEYIFYVGNFKLHKNVARLIGAYNLIDEDVKNKYQLVLAGAKDRNLLRLLKLTEGLKLEEKLLYIGEVGDKHLPALYSGAKIFVMPSLAEGFGLPALEAMSCGTPVIAGNCGALPEVVGEAGLLVNPLNINEITQAISNLLGDTNLYNLMKNNGLTKAEEFKNTQPAEKIIELINEIFHDSKK